MVWRSSRWHDVLDPNIGTVSGRKGKCTADEDSKLKGAVETHCGKHLGAIATLVPGRTEKCRDRWIVCLVCWWKWIQVLVLQRLNVTHYIVLSKAMHLLAKGAVVRGRVQYSSGF
jgi:hypothetical protein